MLLAGGNLAAQGLGSALHMLGPHPHASQVVEQSAGLGEADQRGSRTGHARDARGQVGAGHAQGPVAREEAVVAVRAVVVGPLQGKPTQDGFEGLGATAGVVCRLPAGAGLGRAAMIAEVVVEAPFDRPCGQCQRALAQTGLEGLEIDRVGGPGSYEAGDFGFDGGGRTPARKLFFLTAAGRRLGRRVGAGDRRVAR